MPYGQLTPGDRIGRWTIASILGSGGFGVVVRAHEPGGRDVAIKVLHADLVKSPDIVRRFEREVEVLGQLRHPSMVDIADVGRLADGRPYFAMELLDGEDVGAQLARGGRMSPTQVEAILAQVCDALDTAHRLGIVHRDIKASNVFCTTSGRIVLLDFGIAKLADDSTATLTTSWQVLGTPAYRAPEQVGRTADARSDIYALAALSFEMLTGCRPFAGATTTTLAYLHRHARRPRPSATGVPAAFDPVIARAMSIDPAARHAGALEYLAGFRNALARSVCDPGAARAATRIAALAVHVDVRARGPVDTRLVEDVARVVGVARRWLQAEQFRPAIDGCTTLLMIRPLAGDGDGDARARRAAQDLARDLIAAGDGQRARVQVEVKEDAALIADGDVIGGPILELAAWAGIEGRIGR